MPISDHLKKLYPPDWKELSFWVRFVRAGGKCEACGVENGVTGWRDSEGNFWSEKQIFDAQDAGFELLQEKAGRERILKIVLTVAHKDHNPANNDRLPYEQSNLAAWCQRCHNRHDARHRAVNAAETRRDKKARPIPGIGRDRPTALPQRRKETKKNDPPLAVASDPGPKTPDTGRPS